MRYFRNFQEMYAATRGKAEEIIAVEYKEPNAEPKKKAAPKKKKAEETPKAASKKKPKEKPQSEEGVADVL